MTLVVKKKTLIIIAGILIIAAAVITAVVTAVSAAASTSKIGKTVVIDAGHGGVDGGVIGKITGIKESDINLAVSKSLRHFLESKGYKVIMTRTTTDGLYGMASKNRKSKDMETRRKIIADAKPDLVVSIHQNSFPSPTVRGPQVFYAPNSETGAQYAQTMQNILNTGLDSDRIVKTGDYFILQCSEFPSLLVECGFLSNAEEEKLLISATYQEKVAYAVYTGIHTILFPGEDKETAPPC